MIKKLFSLILISFFLTTPVFGAIIDNLVSYWKLDDNLSTSAVLDAHGSNPGTVVNDQTNYSSEQSTATAKIVRAFDFDGTNDYVECGDVLDLGTNDRTFSAWIKTSGGTGGHQYIVTKARAASQDYRFAVALSITGNGKIFLKGSGGSDFNLNTPSTYDDNSWHHMVWLFDRSGNASIYVDGAFKISGDISGWDGQDFQSSNPFRIGTYTANNNVGIVALFNGLIDEVAIWNRLLTPDEITELWNSGDGLAYPFTVVTARGQVIMIYE